MTKQFQTPILLDDATAAAIAESTESHSLRFRRVARVTPHGMDTVVNISELLNSDVEMRTDQIKLHERSLEMFI